MFKPRQNLLDVRLPSVHQLIRCAETERYIYLTLTTNYLSSHGEKVAQERLEVPFVVGLGGPTSREGSAICDLPSPTAVLAHKGEVDWPAVQLFILQYDRLTPSMRKNYLL